MLYDFSKLNPVDTIQKKIYDLKHYHGYVVALMKLIEAILPPDRGY